MFLIESYQHGHLFQAKMRVPISDAGYYIEITDDNEITRLRPLYKQAKSAPDLVLLRTEYRHKK